jgi:hypothetical protein
MAPRREDVTIAPKEPDAPAGGGARYDGDLYSWALEQARLVREGRLDLIDRDNVAEEIESLGREQFNKLESAFRILLLHMLKWDFQPERRSRSWALSVEEQRLVLDDVLNDNPGLKPRRSEAIARAYRKARLGAARETGLDLATFPDICPYTPDQITTRPFDATPQG